MGSLTASTGLMSRGRVMDGLATRTSSRVRKVNAFPANTGATASRTVWTIQTRTTATTHLAPKRLVQMAPVTTTLSTATGSRTVGTAPTRLTALTHTVPRTSLSALMATASHNPSSVTTGMTVGTTVTSRAVSTKAARAMSLRAPVGDASLSDGCVTTSMTVETTAMRKDVTVTRETVTRESGDVLARPCAFRWTKCAMANLTVLKEQTRATQRLARPAVWNDAPL